MIIYKCDKCKTDINPKTVVYTLITTYGPNNKDERHFHWECLKEYMAEG